MSDMSRGSASYLPQELVIPKLLTQNMRGRMKYFSVQLENCKFEKSYSHLLAENMELFQKVSYDRSMYFKMMLGVINSWESPVFHTTVDTYYRNEEPVAYLRNKSKILIKSWECSFFFPQYQRETQRKQVEKASFERWLGISCGTSTQRRKTCPCRSSAC